MATPVRASVSSMGGKQSGYAKDGSPRWEIRIPLSRAAKLPLKTGEPQEVSVKLGKQRFKGKLHKSLNTPYAYFSPTLSQVDGGNGSVTLGQILSSLGVKRNDRLALTVDGHTIVVNDRWGYGLGTRAARINSVINSEPKSLSQICEAANYWKTGSASSHLTSLLKRGHIARTEGGYVATAASDQGEEARDPDGLTDQQRALATSERRELDLSGEFDPTNQDDARRKIVSSIVRRQGREKFRNQLLTLYKGRCAITGCAVRVVLEAAHITPYLGPKTNHPFNGLLLRADLHTLFDLGLLAIDSGTMTVVTSPELDGSEYEELAGISLRVPEMEAGRPSKAALDAHRMSHEL